MNHLLKISMAALMALGACTSSGKQQPTTASAAAAPMHAAFSADSAYAYVARQVAFGPRVPGTPASEQCARWLGETLMSFGATDVQTQRGKMQAWDGTTLPISNITARVNPQAKKRVLLLSHWDSRPWADQEANPADRERPIDGANDGASGVGVILELVRNAKDLPANVGIDVLLVDAEDYGRRADKPGKGTDDDSWCLGTQYWVENPTLPLEDVRFAVLLDMVGGKDAVFPKEYFSTRYASDIVDKVWRVAAKAGFADRFPNTVGTPVIDDHVYLLQAGIPAIDIIETDHPSGSGFNPTWHTHADNIDNIDPATLGAVGQVLTELIHNL